MNSTDRPLPALPGQRLCGVAHRHADASANPLSLLVLDILQALRCHAEAARRALDADGIATRRLEAARISLAKALAELRTLQRVISGPLQGSIANRLERPTPMDLAADLQRRLHAEGVKVRMVVPEAANHLPVTQQETLRGLLRSLASHAALPAVRSHHHAVHVDTHRDGTAMRSTYAGADAGDVPDLPVLRARTLLEGGRLTTRIGDDVCIVRMALPRHAPHVAADSEDDVMATERQRMSTEAMEDASHHLSVASMVLWARADTMSPDGLRSTTAAVWAGQQALATLDRLLVDSNLAHLGEGQLCGPAAAPHTSLVMLPRRESLDTLQLSVWATVNQILCAAARLGGDDVAVVCTVGPTVAQVHAQLPADDPAVPGPDGCRLEWIRERVLLLQGRWSLIEDDTSRTLTVELPHEQPPG